MSREKQIEEIAKILLIDCEGACTDCEYYGRYNGSVCIPMRLASELYNAGYRKQSEGEWVKVYRNKKCTVYECSNCKHLTFGTSDYCICGAKMKGGAE